MMWHAFLNIQIDTKHYKVNTHWWQILIAMFNGYFYFIEKEILFLKPTRFKQLNLIS